PLWKPLSLIVVGLFVVGTVIALQSGWRPWATEPQAGKNGQTQTSNNTTDLSLSKTAPNGMAYVPGGIFRMGRDDGDEYERPSHRVTVKPFFIDVDEVTLLDYDKFVRATGKHATPAYLAAIAMDSGLKKYGNQPVTGVEWDDAVAYAKWAKKRLPTEEEWEF